MTNLSNNITEFITQFQSALNNAQNNSRIANPMADFGYDAVRFSEGQTLLDDLKSKSVAQTTEYAEKKAATDTVQKAMATLEKEYGVHRAIAKRLFKDNTLIIEQLALDQPKPRKRLQLLEQITTFYTTLLADPAHLAEMAKFGRTEAILQATLQQAQQMPALLDAQKIETAEAQAATRTRDETWEASRIWLSTLLEVAQFALEDDPQMLEALGITA